MWYRVLCARYGEEGGDYASGVVVDLFNGGI